MAELVSSTYAQALFDVCIEQNKVDDILKEIEFLGETINNDNEFYELLRTPKVSINEKKAIIVDVSG